MGNTPEHPSLYRKPPPNRKEKRNPQMQNNYADKIVSIGKGNRLRRRAGFVVGWEEVEVGGEDSHAGNR